MSKLSSGYKLIKNEGFIEFLITTLQKTRRIKPQGITTNNPIYFKVEYDQAIRADISKPPPKWPGTTKEKLTLSWVMPPPSKGSGGHMDIFRFIKALEDAGHKCRIYIYSPDNPSTIDEVKQSMGLSFPKVRASMQWLRSSNITRSDAIIATSWETAYPVYNDSSNAKRFYLVQDFEPYFYEVGGLYLLAENTYRFGFYGITLGPWLARKLKDYGMRTDYVDMGADIDAYKYTNNDQRNEIVFYARPYTGRRAFEMGILALDIFHKMHPEYKINFIGFDVSQYHIPFPYNNLGILETSELNALYNRCAAGLVMSLTNLSLLPFELLACGTVPVINDGENNRLHTNNKFIAYSENNPHAIARLLSKTVSRKSQAKYAYSASKSVKSLSWGTSGKKFVSIVEREMKKAG